MLTLLVLLSVPMLFITVKVRNMVWKNDKVLPLMLCCLTASLFAFIAYFIFELYSEYHLIWQNSESSSYICCLTYFPNMPAFMLSLGIVLNLNKWIHYLLKILVFVRVENQLDKSRSESQRSRSSARMSSSYMSSTMGSQQTFVSV